MLRLDFLLRRLFTSLVVVAGVITLTFFVRQFVLSGSWWVAGFPSLAILLTALAFATLGDSLRAAADPR